MSESYQVLEELSHHFVTMLFGCFQNSFTWLCILIVLLQQAGWKAAVTNTEHDRALSVRQGALRAQSVQPKSLTCTSVARTLLPS